MEVLKTDQLIGRSRWSGDRLWLWLSSCSWLWLEHLDKSFWINHVSYATEAEEDLIQIFLTVGSFGWSKQLIKHNLNSLGSGLSRFPFATDDWTFPQSWFNLFVRRKSQWPSLLRFCHNNTILWMVILQPVKQGKLFPSIVINFAIFSDTGNKNSLWRESFEIAWPNFLELEHDRLLDALNSWSINSIKLTVALASSGMAPS